MKKRGYISGEVIKYMLIAFIVIIIQIAGFKLYQVVKDQQCQTELTRFKIELENLPNSIELGSVDERSYSAPCNAEEILFIDLEQSRDLSVFDKYPLIKDSLKSGIKKNVFVMKDSALISSFYAGNLEFAFPYYSCLIPKNNQVSFFIEGKGIKANLIPGCSQSECTIIPQLRLTDEEAKLIINNAIRLSDCEFCPKNLNEEFIDFKTALKSLNVYRRFKYCPDTGITHVEIILKPKDGVNLKNVRFYEYIPKECIDDLNQYLTENVKGEVQVIGDPLIVWNLHNLNEETVLEYKFNKLLSEECQKLVRGLGLVELAYGEGIDNNNSLNIHLPEQFRMLAGSTKDLPLGASSNKYLREELTWSREEPQNIGIDIESETRNAVVTSSENYIGDEVVTFTVTDPEGNTISEDVNIIIEQDCEESCEECVFPDACAELGTKSCTSEDCSSFEQYCERDTEGTDCGEDKVCKGGFCIQKEITYEPIPALPKLQDDILPDYNPDNLQNCGNGRLDQGEQCDYSDYGGKTCKSLGFSEGSLMCDNCMILTDNCKEGSSTSQSKNKKLLCEEIKKGKKQYNCNIGDCEDEFGAGWEDVGCDSGWGWFKNKRPICKKTYWTSCTENPSCPGTILEQKSC